MLIVLVLFYWCTCLSHSSQSSQFIFFWNFLYNFWHYFVSFTVYLRSFRSRVHNNSMSVIIYLTTYCSMSFLACFVRISRYYFIVSLLFFAFLSKRNGAPCNSADYPGFIYSFCPFKFRRVCGVCSSELWLARKNNCLLSIFFPAGEGGFGQMMYRSLERSPQDPWDGIFLYSAQASFSWPRVDLARL